MMSDSTENPFEKAAAFQKIWMETFTQMAQSGLSFSPDSTPPELLRQMRSGIFSALSKSWEEYMRSPQFMDSMKGMMDKAIAFRKMGNDMLTKAHHSMQGTARSDIDDLMQAIHIMETRILNRVEEVSTRLDELEQKSNGRPRNGTAKRPTRPAVTTAQRRAAQKPKSPSEATL